jgi:hypothetical protein
MSTETAALTPRQALASKVSDALNSRQTWSKKLTTYYDMRRDGLRRPNKPWPGAADLHEPLIDDVITGKHPFYAGQLFGAERIASFSPADDIGLPAQAELANKAAEWFDDQLKVGTTLFQESLIANDAMMQTGRGVIMALWDATDEKLAFKAIDPQHFIVPRNTEDLQKAHWVARVVVLSCDDYETGPYNQELLAQVKGKGQGDGMADDARAVRYQREGITYGMEDEVVLWEIYRKERDKATGAVKVRVETIAPVNPDAKVRPDYFLPLWHEVRENGATVTLYPFVDLPNEVVEAGWYSSRGDAEKLAPFEAWATKCWNKKADHMDFSTNPAFTGGREKNLANKKFVPGQVVEGDLKMVEMPAPPFSLDDERMRTRSLAEQRAKLPDFGIGGRNGGKSKTATEVDAIQQFATNGVEMLANVYRMRLTNLMAMSWAILIQMRAAKLVAVLGLPPGITPDKLIRAFRVVIAGSVDSWNKTFQQQRALLLWNTFKGDPQINQTELRKLVLEGLDARLVKRLMVDPKIRASDEAEDEAMEIVLMLNGFPAVPMEGEDHAGRAIMITQKMQAEALEAAQEESGEEQAEKAKTMRAVQLLAQHRGIHLSMLQKQDPAAAAQAAQQIKQIEMQTAAMLKQIEVQKAQAAMQQKLPQGPAPTFPPAA